MREFVTMRLDGRLSFCVLEVVAVVVLVSAVVECRPRTRRVIGLRSAPVNSEPTQPKDFQSVDELSKYLDNLSEYYKMMSRPR